MDENGDHKCKLGEPDQLILYILIVRSRIMNFLSGKNRKPLSLERYSSSIIAQKFV